MEDVVEAMEICQERYMGQTKGDSTMHDFYSSWKKMVESTCRYKSQIYRGLRCSQGTTTRLIIRIANKRPSELSVHNKNFQQ